MIKDFFKSCFSPDGNVFSHTFGYFFFSAILYLPISLIFSMLNIQYIGDFLPADPFAMLVSGTIIFFWASSSYISHFGLYEERINSLEDQAREKQSEYCELPRVLCDKLKLSFDKKALLYEALNDMDKQNP